MSIAKIFNKGTTTLSDNRFIESLTRTHFLVPVIFYSSLAIAIIAFTLCNHFPDPLKILYILPLGVFSFTIVEYFIHRFIFHFEPKNKTQEKIKYKIHGVHHEYPRDKDRLAMPPVFSICLALIFYGIFKSLMGNLVLYFFPGFLLGYVVYLIIHYVVHRFRPPHNFLKILWTHHALHHYKNDNAFFGVSMPLWDYVFGTIPNEEKAG